ncbi:hypothetical protein COT97_00350 [Candidatus Falkowbacteria bacterium CG10_big_fil_rev_8_21_14_0_10_39_11]|uniref:Uncharacterized protein n=1 Tax=Candidatus Falkowbacteria bacterium CG10_big_fil_rev_8_21_14_0_10_39_11 TaxID=1974565 RepID=A0A2H0V688_9BACT|nr:MAG: hypothetical protein COT97_00350 [Candidatus Falkowbacteria bacterium CG10_big_fil_rev_8_21_14_0_10_39_11]
MEGLRIRFLEIQKFYGSFPVDSDLGKSLQSSGKVAERVISTDDVMTIVSVSNVAGGKTIFVAVPERSKRQRRIVFRNIDNMAIELVA